MGYDEAFWRKYADGNEARYNEEFAKFVRDLAASLRCTSVLEVGCGTGIDLRLFPDTFQVHGVDLSEHALGLARGKLPAANYRIGDITSLPFEDSAVDFVFTHGLLNYLDEETLQKGIAEMHRVSGKYVMNCEMFGSTEKDIGEGRTSRNMAGRWADYNVRIVSDVDMHEDIEPEKKRFVLIRKL